VNVSEIALQGARVQRVNGLVDDGGIWRYALSPTRRYADTTLHWRELGRFAGCRVLEMIAKLRHSH
jgi:hypothetical protein